MNEDTCLSHKSLFNQNEYKCEWHYGIGGVSFDECLWTKPKINLFVVGYIVIMVILISLPLNVLSDQTFSHILKAPTPAHINESLEYAEMGKRFYKVLSNSIGSFLSTFSISDKSNNNEINNKQILPAKFCFI